MTGVYMRQAFNRNKIAWACAELSNFPEIVAVGEEEDVLRVTYIYFSFPLLQCLKFPERKLCRQQTSFASVPPCFLPAEKATGCH